MNGEPKRLAGVPLEAWELLDPALQEALMDGRLRPDELPELAGWLDVGDDRGPGQAA